MVRGIYVSCDEVARDEARERGYHNICLHPNEIGVPETGETVVINLDSVLFDDKDAAVAKANELASCGVNVGIHTYYPNDPRLRIHLALPNVVVAKTHRRVLAKMRRLARKRRQLFQNANCV